MGENRSETWTSLRLPRPMLTEADIESPHRDPSRSRLLPVKAAKPEPYAWRIEEVTKLPLEFKHSQDAYQAATRNH